MMAMYYPRATPRMHVGDLGVQLVDKGRVALTPFTIFHIGILGEN